MIQTTLVLFWGACRLTFNNNNGKYAIHKKPVLHWICFSEQWPPQHLEHPNVRGTPYHHPTIPPICAISVSVVIFKLDGLSLQFGVAFFSTPKNSRLLGDSWVFPYEQTHNTNLTAKLWRRSLQGWFHEFFNGKMMNIWFLALLKAGTNRYLFEKKTSPVLGWRLAKTNIFPVQKEEVHHTALFT